MIDRILAPKVYPFVVAGGAVLGGMHFGESVSVGAIVVASVVVVLGGLFTLRNNMKSFWKDLAEERGEQVKVLEAEVRAGAEALRESQAAASAEALRLVEEQREIRHGLKGTIATLENRLAIEEAKHDLSGVTTRIGKLEEFIHTRTPIVDRLADDTIRTSQMIERNNVLLTEIASKLIDNHEGGTV